MTAIPGLQGAGRPVRAVLLAAAFLAGVAMWSTGCAPAAVGAGASGTYKAGTDERTVGRQMDDSLLSAQVKSALIDDRYVEARHVDVDVYQGIVFLTGTAPDEEHRRRAAEVADAVVGVRKVVNDLHLGSLDLSHGVHDASLTAQVKAQLVGTEGLRSWNIDVDTVDAIVYLKGVVPSQKEADLAKAVASAVAGVRAVTSRLLVVAGE
ncbi:MAG: BON domain-containing protein [Thermodesulfobacteriota bacterium]